LNKKRLWKAKHRDKYKKILVKPTIGILCCSSSNSKLFRISTQSTSTTVVRPTLDVKKNKHFWSFYEDFKDDEVEIKDELGCFSIEDLVVEEITKYRERNN
jgi:hypothetical protein